MAIVPIADAYTDNATPPTRWLSNVPVVAAAGRIVMVTAVTNSTGPIITNLRRLSLVPTPIGASARAYTLTSTGWDRGDPTTIPMDTSTSHAAAATVEGDVVVQGAYTQVTAVPRHLQTGVALRWGSTTPPSTRVNNASYTSSVQGMTFRVFQKIWIDSVTFYLAADDPGTTHMTVSIALDSNGSQLGTTATVPVDGNAGTYTQSFTSPIYVSPSIDYRVEFHPTGVTPLDTGRLVHSSVVGAAGDFGDAYQGVLTNGVRQVGDNTGLWFSLHYNEVDSYTTSQLQNGYCLLDVNGAAITASTPVAAEAGFAPSWGDLISGPDAMVRIPGTDRFWAWRSYPAAGILAVDLIQVSGLTVTIEATTHVDTNAGYILTDTPHKIIPISSTEAISMLTLAGTITLVHLKYDGTTTLVVNVQNIPGYQPGEGATLIAAPSSASTHQAETMFKLTAGDPLTLIRLGVTWTGSAFTAVSLPITQFTAATVAPPNYTPRTNTSHLSLVKNSAATAFDGYAVVARQFIDNGSDDNWILLTQYDLNNGTIVANTWAKGDANGAPKDYLYGYAPALVWDAGTDRLIVADVERWDRQAAGTIQASPRLGIYRVSYTLDDAARSQRERFER